MAREQKVEREQREEEKKESGSERISNSNDFVVAREQRIFFDICVQIYFNLQWKMHTFCSHGLRGDGVLTHREGRRRKMRIILNLSAMLRINNSM